MVARIFKDSLKLKGLIGYLVEMEKEGRVLSPLLAGARLASGFIYAVINSPNKGNPSNLPGCRF